jgi:galactokinase
VSAPAQASPPPGEPRLAALADRARGAFAAHFGRPATLVVAAPGRVNLIGEHTDYNGGFVLPMAIDRHVVAAAAPGPAGARRWRVHSAELAGEAELPTDTPAPPGAPAWANYLRGVLAGYLERGWALPGLDVALVSDLPLGGGLSSSAALEVAGATLIEAACGQTLPALERARLCQRAEQRWAGVPCGIMDQLASVGGQEAGALLIDCQSERFQVIAIPDEVGVLVTNSQVRHALGDGEYARRRADCEEAARLLGVASLRTVSAEQLATASDRLPPVIARRARHVVQENARALAFADALAGRDLARAGALLYDSHRSLRDDYQVSCPELDALVEIAAELGPAGGVIGARMTGGGFGGCTVTLVHKAQLSAVAAALSEAYAQRCGRQTLPFAALPSRGAHRLPDPPGP